MYTENDDYVDNEYDNTENEVETVTVENNSNKSKYIIIVILFLLVVGLIAFILLKDKIFTKKENNYVINLYPENIVIGIGQTESVSYELRNNGEIIPNAAIRLAIDNESIAIIDNLDITGVSYGKTVLTATYVDDDGKEVKEIKDVTVADGNSTVAVTGISIPEGDLQLPFNGSYIIPITIEPEDGYVESKTFTSSNSNVAIVDNTGKITAMDEGEAVITIVVNGTIKKELKVIVNGDVEKPQQVVKPSSITITNSLAKMTEGDSTTLSYTLLPENASKDDLVWSSSDSSIIKVDNTGKITALKEGTATIKLSSGDVVGSVSIIVEKKVTLVTDITLSTTELSLMVGQNQIILPTVVPNDATDKTLNYESSDANIVTVTKTDDNGANLEAKSVGTATIVIKSSNGIEKNVTVTVTENTSVDPTPTPGSGGSSGGGGYSCKKTCPDGQYVSNCKCVTCEANYYCKDGKKTACSSGYTSQAGASSCTRKTCSAGTYLDSSYSTGCRPCPSGKYCSGGTALPKTCPSGQIVNSTKTGCTKCSISNCKAYGGNGTTCKCTSCNNNYQVNSTQTACVAVTKSCASRSTVGECNASSNCKWDYTYGCRNK